MKYKETISLLCTAAMLVSFTGAPVMQAQAYEIEAEASSDGEAVSPVMPEEIANRKKKNYKIQETAETFGNFLYDHVLVMPGDTFEFVPIVDEDNKCFSYVDDQYMAVNEEFQNEGFEITGTVDAIETYSRTFKNNGEEKTMTCNVKWKNNTNCPLTVEGAFSGDGPIVSQWGYRVLGIKVRIYKPYYNINWLFDEQNGAEWSDPSEVFFEAGEYDKITFPSEYWLTDTPYVMSVPQPKKRGEHFEYYGTQGENPEKVTHDGVYVNYAVSWQPKESGYGEYDFDSYGDVTMNIYSKEGATLTLFGNGGTIRGRDKWIVELPDIDGGEENTFDLSAYTPDRENDTFLGWCTKESALYGSYFTKDSSVDVLSNFGELVHNYSGSGILYAKWESETEEALEKHGWDLYPDGTLWLLNFDGQQAWIEACENDPGLAPKVKKVKTGYKDEEVNIFLFNNFKDCVNLEEFETKPEQQLNSANIFEGCTNLKKVILNYQPDASVYYAMSEGTFEGAGKDLVVVVPEDKLADFKEMFPESAYLFNADETDVRYPLTVNGVVLTKKHNSVKCGEGTASYDEATNTLTLDNADMTQAFIPHFMPKYFIDDEENWIQYDKAAVVSAIPDLKIVLKGKNVVHTGQDNRDYPFFLMSYNNASISGDGSMEASFYSENYLIVDNETGESNPAPPSTGKLLFNVCGDLTLDGITAARLIAEPQGTLTMKNCTLDGGVYSSVKSISDTKINQFRGSYSGFGMPEETKITSCGDSLTIGNTTIERTYLEAEDAKNVTIKDSSIHLDGIITGGENTKLDIVNSTIEGWGQENGVTTIPQANITLTDCQITSGGWDKNEYFKITSKDDLEIETPEVYLLNYDTNAWNKSSDEMFCFDVLGDTSKDTFSGTFVKLLIDSQQVPSGKFTTKENGNRLEISISPEYLGGLALGEHSVIAVFEDGSTEFTMIIYEAGSSDTDINSDFDIDSDSDTDTDHGQPDFRNSGDYDYLIFKAENGEDTALIVGYNGSEENVIVPSVIDSIPVVSVGQQAFEHNKTIKSVTLPEGLKIIGPMAFIDCPNLTEVVFPGFSLESIGESAFEGCGLTQVRIPWETDKVEKRAFANNPLTQVELEYGISEVGEEAFAGCDKLEEMFFTNTVKSIKARAFNGCNSLKKITVIDKETKIDPTAFTDKDGNDLPLTVCAYAGSTAEAFAQARKNMKFEEIDDSVKLHLRFGLATSDDVEVTDGSYTKKFNDAAETFKLPDAKLEGREFMGWYKLDWFTGVYSKVDEVSEKTFWIGDIGDDPDSTALAMEIELFAVFRKTADSGAELVLNANGGTLDGNSTGSYILGNTHGEKKLQVLGCFVPEKQGAKFVGWNTKPDGSGVTVNSVRLPADKNAEQKFEGYDVNEKTYVFLDGTGGKVQLYAVWEGGSDQPANGIYGDVDSDGQILSSDALMILRSSVNLMDFTPEQLIAADVDFDGMITATDALSVLRYSVSLSAPENIGKPITYTT